MFHRLRLFAFSLCLSLVMSLPAWAGETLRKISFIDTGNYLLSQQYAYLLLPQSLRGQDVLALRDYAHKLLADASADEWSRILRTANWVHQHIQHDSFNQTIGASSLQILQRAQQGERFSCVEYAKVLRDSLTMQGIVARSIGLQSTSIAYGTLGSSHVADEVWSDTYAKWVLLDAQFGVYPSRHKQPLNLHELYQLQRQGKINEVRFVGFDGRADKKRDSEYRRFIRNYLGFMSFRISSDKGTLNLVYPLAGKNLPLTFQGLPKNQQLFTRNPQDVYFPLNQAHAVFHFAHYEQSYQQFAQAEFKDESEYLKQMAKFAPGGQVVVELDQNMPWFDHFEIRRENANWQKLAANRVDWSLHLGTNRLQIRAVNSSGIKGPISLLELLYQ